MKQWAFAAALATALAGCGTGMPLSPDEGQLVRRLQSVKDTYWEYEPLDLLLVTVNNTDKPQPLGLQERGGYLVVHEITDNDEILWRPIPVTQDVAAQQVMPGETVDLRLGLAGRAAPTRPGTWVVSYRYYPQAGERRKVVFVTQDIFVQCVRQGLVVPPGTPADVTAALAALLDAPAHDYLSRFPAWTQVNDGDAMRRLRAMGDRAAPALLANLNHYRIRPAVIQLLADIKYAPAVPALIYLLRMNDGTQDRLILSALAHVTGHPKGFEFYTHWGEMETKEDALRAYRTWRP